MDTLLKINVQKILSIFAVSLNKGVIKEISDRQHNSFVLVKHGLVSYYQNGTHIRSDPDHVLLLPVQSTYRLVCDEACECLMIDFSIVDAEIPSDIRNYPITDLVMYANMFHQADNAWTFDRASTPIYCKSVLYRIISKLCDEFDSHTILKGKYACIKPSVKYMENHWNDPLINNDVLAKESNISNVYFRKIFRCVFGQSPMKYIQIKRIEKAKELLESDLMPVYAIAEAVGFSSVYHFSRVFKLETGVTPSDFRKRSSSDMDTI